MIRVEVGRIAHGFGNALPSALRAAVPDRERGTRAVEGVDDGLRLHRHLVHRRDTRSRSPSRDVRARTRRCCRRARYRCSPSRSPPPRRRPARIRDAARPSTVADGLELSVPSRRRQPDLDLDVRIARRRQRRRDAAERRQRRIHARRLWRRAALSRGARRSERAGGDLLRDGDLRVIERQTRERLTRRRVRRERKPETHDQDAQEDRA